VLWPARRGSEAHEGGAQWSAFRHLEQKSAARGRAERASAQRLLREEEGKRGFASAPRR
jgi:hypothetical protein